MTRRRAVVEEVALVAVLALGSACARVRPAATALAPPPRFTQRALLVRDHGRLLVSVPPGWTASEGEEDDASVPSLRLEKSGADFLLLLTPLWNPGEPESPQARIDTAQLFADIARRKALAGAVEPEIPLEELAGPGVRGFWFAATDRDLEGREPEPGEWRHVLQGAAAIGPVILAFTLLDDGPGPQRAQVLDLVRGARHAPDAEANDEAYGELEPMPGVQTSPLRVAWPGKSWAVLVDLPGFEVLRVARARVEPDAVHVIGRDAETNIVASVLVRRANVATDARACRAAALKELASAAGPLLDLRLDERGGAARAFFGRQENVRWEHAHAFLHRDRLCADFHVSKAALAPGDDVRIEAILSSFRLVEDL